MTQWALPGPIRKLIGRRQMAQRGRDLMGWLPGALEHWRETCLNTRRSALVRDFVERLDDIPDRDLGSPAGLGAPVLVALGEVVQRWHAGRDECAREAVRQFGRPAVVILEYHGLSADLGKAIGGIFDDATAALQVDLTAVVSARVPVS